MKRIAIFITILVLISLSCISGNGIAIPTSTIDQKYFDDYYLDAEYLAELGIKNKYEILLPELKQLITKPENIEEMIDSEKGIYIILYKDREYVIQSPEYNDTGFESWGRATFALFDIINDQLNETDHRFYAINGGNDLAGIFLTMEELEKIKQTITNKRDWPFLPINDPPWYGQSH